MAYFNGQQIVSGILAANQYKWVLLASGTLAESTMNVFSDKLNGRDVPLYGAAMKYTAPKRAGENSYALYLHLGKATYNEAGVRINFDPVVKVGVPNGSSNLNARYGSAVVDGSQGVYRLQWNVGNCPPSEYSDSSSLRPGAHGYSFIDTDPECNSACIYIPQGIDAGTEYEIWGLIKQF